MGLHPAPLRRWELYSFQFINYIFHSEDGKRVRGRFIRRVLWRTFIYALWGLPAFGLLHIKGWVNIDSIPRIAGFLFLDFDFAFGIAVIKTVGEYRYRIELIYREEPADLDDPDALPQGHRELAISTETRPRKTHEEPVDPSAFLSTLLDGNEPLREPAQDNPPATVQESEDSPESGGKIVLECTACKKHIYPSDEQTAQRMERCLYCGSPLKKVYE